jgi:hypothetical protein
MREFITILESHVEDRRESWKINHKLIDIVMIVMWSGISDCDKWEDVEDFATENEEVFREFLELPYGIPSHDTMQRVMRIVDGEHINRIFVSWLESKLEEKGCVLKEDLEYEITSIDGKTARGSKNDYHKAVHIVRNSKEITCSKLFQKFAPKREYFKTKEQLIL